MQVRKPIGQGASAIKYDLLTAMGAYGLAQSKGAQVLVFRLMTLVTARYNWQRSLLAVGQREIARLWNVDERTVKREMAKLRAMGWLVVTRQGARGRVSEYALDLDKILLDTKDKWAAVGPDFDHRLSQRDADNSAETNVVRLPIGKTAMAPDTSDGQEWSLAQAILYREDPATYSAWIAALKRSERSGGRLTLIAPSRFHANYVLANLKDRMLAACRDVDGEVQDLFVTA